jgi:hypothetical protein
VTLTVLLHSHRSCAVHWEVKRTGILTDRWKGMQAGAGPVYVDARKQSGGCRGRRLCPDLLHAAHRPGNVEGQESTLGNSVESSVLGADFKPQGHLKKYVPGLFPIFLMFWFQVKIFLVETSMSLLSDMPAVPISLLCLFSFVRISTLLAK